MELLMQRWFSGPLGAALVRLLNMSAAAGVLICVVALLRLCLRRAPKWTRGILWGIVAVQLVCPVSLRSPLSVYGLLPRSSDVQSDQVEVFRLGGGSEKPLLVLEAPQIAGYAPVPTAAPLPTASPTDADAPAAQTGPSVPAHTDPAPQAKLGPDIFLPTAGAVWLAGVALMLLYALSSWLTLRRRVRASVPLDEAPFRLCDGIGTPFILGVLRPRVYIPSGLNDAQRAAVAAHEKAHLRRGDHWWKLLGWLLLAVHWFNPLVWLAYVLFCRDIELGCDERAVRDMDTAQRADYSQALLDCAAPRPLARVCPLAFGEVGIRERVKAVLHYKKPAFWIIVAAVAVCAVVAVCFLTRPGPIAVPEPWEVTVTATPRPTEPPTPTPTGQPVYDFSNGSVYLLDEASYDGPFASLRFSIVIDREREMFQFYESPISSYIGIGKYELDGDILTIRDSFTPSGRVNRFRLSDDGETLVWIEEGSDNFHFVHLTDGAVFRLNGASEAPWPMTLDDVRSLAEKGEALTWEDLLCFAGTDIGSGMYIYRFPIDADYCLEAGDGKLTGTPQRVMLLAADGTGTFSYAPGLCIDIRREDVDAFLSRPLGAYLTVTSGGQTAAALPYMVNTRTWSDEVRAWIIGDCAPVQTLLERPEQIPTLTLADDFTLTFGGGAVRKSALLVYDEQFTLLHPKAAYDGDTALNWLEAGTYYCGVEVHGPLGRYIEQEGAYEESAYLCVFRLVVPVGERPAPFTPAEAHDLVKAELRAAGEVHTVADAAALAQLQLWFANATELPSAGCPFSSVLTLTRADGSEFSLCPAEDSCGVVFADGHYFRYAADNAAFWRMFGLYPQ